MATWPSPIGTIRRADEGARSRDGSSSTVWFERVLRPGATAAGSYPVDTAPWTARPSREPRVKTIGIVGGIWARIDHRFTT
jgi:hypothetical protein